MENTKTNIKCRTVVLYNNKEFKSDWVEYSKEEYEDDSSLILKISQNTKSERYLSFKGDNKEYYFNGEILNKSIIYMETEK